MRLYGVNRRTFFNGKLAANDQIDKRFMMTEGGLSIPAPGPCTYINIIFKHLLRLLSANQSLIKSGASMGKANDSLYKWSWSHVQDGRHANIW